MKIWETSLGPDHPFLVKGLSNLGILYWRMGRPEEAELFLKKTLILAENAFGPEHPLLGYVLWDYAFILRQTKRKSEAREMEKRAHAIMQKAYRDNPARHTVDISELAGFRNSRPRK